MSSFTAVNLSRLPVPDVIEQIDYETLLAALRADLQARLPTFDAWLPSDPIIKLLEVAAYREMLLRQQFNDRARSVMLAYALGSDLDHLGALLGVTRRLIDPGNLAKQQPARYESDDDFRRRITLAPESFSVAGPEGAYIYHALGAHADVLDASVSSPAAGQVQVHLLSRLALDWLVFGNGYLECRKALSGEPLQCVVSPAKYTRRGIENGRWFLLRPGITEHEFAKDSLWHIIEPDIHQELYGLPEYLSALQSAYLNESATLFRRRYYLNGSHAGFILYVNDAAQQMSDIDAIRDALKQSKGPGNFRNLFLYSPNGKKDGVQVIPISEVAAKDEFLGIKEASRDDILAAHRIPPQLLGVVPSNSGGFGDIAKAAQIWARNELEPLQLRLMEFNTWIGEKVMTFKPYTLPEA